MERVYDAPGTTTTPRRAPRRHFSTAANQDDAFNLPTQSADARRVYPVDFLRCSNGTHAINSDFHQATMAARELTPDRRARAWRYAMYTAGACGLTGKARRREARKIMSEALGRRPYDWSRLSTPAPLPPLLVKPKPIVLKPHTFRPWQTAAMRQPRRRASTCRRSSRGKPSDDDGPGRAGRPLTDRRLRELAALSAKPVSLALIHEERRWGARRAAA